MARARYFEVATDSAGRPLASVAVNVYQAGTTTPIVETIYAADTGGTTLANPLTANAQGEIEFYLAAPKRFDLRWVKTGYTTESHPADAIGADLFVHATEKAAAGGVATLDGSGLVPVGQLPGGAALDAEVASAIDAHEVDPAGHIGTYVALTGDQSIAGLKTFTGGLRSTLASIGEGFKIAVDGVDPWFHINEYGVGAVGNGTTKIPYIAVECDEPQSVAILMSASRNDLAEPYCNLKAYSKTGLFPFLYVRAPDDIWLRPGTSQTDTDRTKKVRVLASNGMTVENWAGGITYWTFNAAGHLMGGVGRYLGIGGTSPPSALVDLRPAAAEKAFFAKLAATPTGNAIEIQDSTSAVLFKVRSDAMVCGVGFRNAADNGPWFQMTATGISVKDLTAATAVALGNAACALQVNPTVAGSYGVLVVQKAGQTSPLLEVVASDGTTPLSRISKNGYFMTRLAAAPADAELAATEMAFWFDSTNGAAKAMFKAKQANGTVVTGSVALA